MCDHDVADDRQPEPGTAPPVRRLAEPDEALEDPFAVDRRDARPVVADGQLDDIAGLTQPDPDRTGRVVLGVVQQVAYHPPELFGVTANPAAIDLSHIDAYRRPSEQVTRLGEDQLVEIDDGQRADRAAPVDPGEQQQVVDEPLQAGLFGEPPGGPVGQGDGARPGPPPPQPRPGRRGP